MKGAASVLAAGAARAAGRRTALTRTNALSSRSLMRTAVAPSITTAANASISIAYSGTRPVMVFTAGVPGSGKTYVLNRLYGLDSLEMLDLDAVMPEHPRFDPNHPELLYEQKAAYDWADERIEERFQQLCRTPRYSSTGLGRMVCLDGTGTNVERQRRRMREAKAAGYWTTLLYVHVSLETCIRRNRQRERQVPEPVLRDYLSRLDAAVQAVREDEAGLVDEVVAIDNDRPDEFSDEESRWGRHLDMMRNKSRKAALLFEGVAQLV